MAQSVKSLLNKQEYVCSISQDLYKRAEVEPAFLTDADVKKGEWLELSKQSVEPA